MGGRSCEAFYLSDWVPENPHEMGKSCDSRPSQKQRTESAEKREIPKIGIFGQSATFARNAEARPVLAFRAGKKRPEQSLV